MTILNPVNETPLYVTIPYASRGTGLNQIFIETSATYFDPHNEVGDTPMVGSKVNRLTGELLVHLLDLIDLVEVMKESGIPID